MKKQEKEVLAFGLDLTLNMIQWCFNELHYKVNLVPEESPPPPPIVIFNGNIIKSDTAIPPELK